MPVRVEENLPAPPAHQGLANERHPSSAWRPGKAVWIPAAVLAVLLIVGGSLFAHWPFTRAALIQSLEQDSQGQVEIGPYRQTFFPHPGCVAENVVFERGAGAPKLTIRRLTIVGSYLGMLDRYIPQVIAVGAVLTVPQGQLGELFASHSEQQPTDTSVGEIDADDAQIVVATEDGNQPLDFDFHELKLRDVSKDSAVGFVASLQTPEPTGDLQIQGKVGPFRRDQAGITPLSGTYSYKNAKLEEFTGIGGVLSSDGKFAGQLQAITVDGTTDTSDFQLDVGAHPIELKTKFHAVVDGTNGDLSLDPVESSWGKTTVISRGTIQGPSGDKKNKTVTLEMKSSSGRVEDLLRLFVHDNQPPMSGAITFNARVTLPPGPIEGFLNRLKLDGDFDIKDGKYTHHQTQQDVEILSARARGQADKIEDDQDRDKKNGTDTVDQDLEPVVSTSQGHVVLRKGIANFTDLTFEVPGATSQLTGTYNVRSQAINGKGTVHLDTKLSKATTGVKSFLLKVVGPLSHKKDAKGSTVWVHVTGTYGHPSFSVLPMKGGS